MAKKTARIKPVKKERVVTKPAAHKDKHDTAAEITAAREVLEYAARFLLVRDQASADALRRGLIDQGIIKE
jgi:histidinol-phosphate/aromatic aminotransferase/cobyric acid decarboxylase-like protein